MTTTTADQTPAPTHVSQLATVPEVARFLQLNVHTVRAYAREGIIPAYRVGRGFRFDLAQVGRWLHSRQAHPSNQDQDQGELLHLVVDDAPATTASRKAKASR